MESMSHVFQIHQERRNQARNFKGRDSVQTLKKTERACEFSMAVIEHQDHGSLQEQGFVLTVPHYDRKSQHQVAGMVREGSLRLECGLETSKPTPSYVLPLKLPKQHH